MGWWASQGGQEGGRAAGTAQEKREPLRTAQTLKVGIEDWQQSAFTLHRVHTRWISLCLSQQEAPSKLGKRAGEPSVLRLLVVQYSVSFSPHPPPPRL